MVPPRNFYSFLFCFLSIIALVHVLGVLCISGNIQILFLIPGDQAGWLAWSLNENMSKTEQDCIFPPSCVLETFQEVLKAGASRLQAGQSV